MKTTISALLILLPFSLLANDLDSKLRKMLRQQNIDAINIKRDISSPLYRLGEKLFSDTELSGNRNISCQTCHHPDLGSSDMLPLPIGEGGNGLGRNRTVDDGDIIPRNSPHLFNAAITGNKVMFWDGRVTYNPKNNSFITPEKGINGANPKHPELCEPLTSALSAQAMFPPLSHSEMRGKPGSNEIADAKNNIEAWSKLTKRITSKSEYIALLNTAMPTVKLKKITFGHLAEAIGHFQSNKFLLTNTPFDQYIRGDNNALSINAKKGATLFYSSARCFMCHSGSNMTDEKFHNVAFPQVGPGKHSGDDLGLYAETQKNEDLYKFKTPGLKNISLSAPYGHSGSLKTLKSVVTHYSHPMRSNHHYDGGFRNLPYSLPVDWNNMNKRLRLIDPQVGRMGIPMNSDDIDNIVTFLIEGLTQKDF